MMIAAVVLLAATAAGADQSAAMKAWQAYMTPGEAQAGMARYVGRWDVETRYWHVPGQPPEVTRGQAVYTMILGGRYLRSRYTGTSMGQPFEGMGLEGYDNALREYSSVWVDTMGTGMAVARGRLQPDGRTVVYHGTRTDPVTRSEVAFRSEWIHVDASRWEFVIYETMGGQEVKVMDMTATRPAP
jgi:hypothetical protein